MISDFVLARATTQKLRMHVLGRVQSHKWMPPTRWIKSTSALVHWADALIIASPIRWGAASSLYFKMAERLNCVQNAITIRNHVLIRNKVAGFIIVGGQDNIQAVAGHMLGFIFPQFPYIAHSRGWSHEDMEHNVEIVRNSKELAEGAEMLAKRCLELAAHLVARDEAPSSIERGGRKPHAVHL